MKNKNLIESKEHLYYELALIINKKLYDLESISFMVFKNTEDFLLNKISKKRDS